MCITRNEFNKKKRDCNTVAMRETAATIKSGAIISLTVVLHAFAVFTCAQSFLSCICNIAVLPSTHK